MEPLLTEPSQVIEAGLREGEATEACTSAEVASRPGMLRSLLGVLIAGAHVSAKRASSKKTYARALFPYHPLSSEARYPSALAPRCSSKNASTRPHESCAADSS